MSSGEPYRIEPNIKTLLIAFLITMLAVSFTSIGIRLYLRRRAKSHLGLDDLFLIGAVIMAIGLSIAVFVGLTPGNTISDRPDNGSISIEDVWNSNRYKAIRYTADILIPATLAFIQLSLTSLYTRLFYPLTFLVRILICMVFVSSLACILAAPAGVLAERFYEDSNFSTNAWYDGIQILHTTTVFGVWLLYYLKMYASDISKSGKATLAGQLAAGLITLTSSILRIHSLLRLKFGQNRIPEDISVPLLFSIAEITMGVPYACIPILHREFSSRETSSVTGQTWHWFRGIKTTSETSFERNSELELPTDEQQRFEVDGAFASSQYGVRRIPIAGPTYELETTERPRELK